MYLLRRTFKLNGTILDWLLQIIINTMMFYTLSPVNYKPYEL